MANEDGVGAGAGGNTGARNASASTNVRPHDVDTEALDVDMDGSEPPRPALPPLPLPPPGAASAADLDPDEVQRAKARLDGLVLEARAGSGAAAAILWFEAGRLSEHELLDVKNAAGFYQQSHTSDPEFLPVIHAARRLFGQLQKWGAVVMMIDRELALSGAPSTQLLVEKARLFEARLQRPEDAVALYKQALAVDAGFAPAVDGLSRHLIARDAWSELVPVLRAAAEATPRAAQRCAWLLEAGRIAEARLGQDDEALALYERAAQAGPERRNVLEALRRMYARRGDTEKLGATLERLVDAGGAAAEVIALLCERARTLASVGQELQAVGALEAARERAPEDTLVLGDLARLYERLEMWPALVDALEQHARGTRDRAELLALFAEAGKIAEERLGDVERAIRLYGSCVEVDPTYGPALTALGKLFAKTRRYLELSSVYDVQISSTQDAQHKVNLLFKQAELLADKLEDSDRALVRLADILALQPGWAPALKMTSALYARLGRWEELIKTYESEIEGASATRKPDREQALFLLEKIAGVVEDKLQDAARAASIYRRMLEVQPGYLHALRSLGRLYARLERWDDLLAINAAEAEATGDQTQIVSLLFKNGEILAERLGRIDEAIDAYRQALTLMPTFLPALKALGSIYARAGRYEDLIAMHKEEAEYAKRKEQRAYLLFQVAQIWDERVLDTQQSIQAYRAVLEEDPSYHPAIRALARIHTRQGDWEALLAVHRQELAILSEPRDRALMRCRIAELLDRRLSRAQEAVSTLEAALEDQPSLLAAHEQLVAVHARRGDAPAEVAARERMQGVLADTDGRVANQKALADLAFYRLDDAKRALEAGERVLADLPEDHGALRFVLGCALKLRDHRLAISIAERLARRESSADEAANLFLQVAGWKESDVDPPEDPLPAYVAALDVDPENPTALRAVERHYVERRSWDGLYALYDRERARATDAGTLTDLLMKMGEIAEKRLAKPESALSCYEQVIKSQPGHIAAITRLKDLYGALGRASDQLRMLSAEAVASKDPARAISTLLEAGQLQRDKFNNIDAAVDCFQKVLERDPQHAEAYAALEAMLVTFSRDDDLAKLYLHRASSLSETSHRVELLIKAAHLLSERLKRFGDAAAAYDSVLSLVPGHPGALLQAGNLRFALQDWEGAERSYGELVRGGAADPLSLVPVHERLGIIFADHLPEPTRAISHLTSCLAMQPENREARKRLAKSYAAAGSAAQALASYKQLAETAEPTPAGRAEKRELHRIAAAILERQLNDVPAATAQLEQALVVTDDPDERHALLDDIAALYERAGNLQGLVDASAKQAEQLSSSEPRRAADLLLRNARLYLEKLNNQEAALRSARRGLEVSPEHVELRGFLADLYGRIPNQQLLAVEEHRRILRAGHVRTASVHALFRAWQAQRAHDRAFVAAEVLSFLGVGDESSELFFNENKKRMKKGSDQQLTPEQVVGWLVHPGERGPIREMLAAALPDLQKAFASDALEPLTDKKNLLKPRTDDPLRTLADEIGANLGVGGFDIHKSPTKKNAVEAHTASPMVLVVGADVIRTQPTREQRFLIARELTAIACGHTLVRGMTSMELATFVSALGRSVEKTFPAFGDTGELDAWAKKIGSALSRKAKGLVGDAVARLSTARAPDFVALQQAMTMTEARGGLLLSGALDAALRLVAKELGKSFAGEVQRIATTIEAEPRLADLVSFSLSDDHFQARSALRFNIDA